MNFFVFVIFSFSPLSLLLSLPCLSVSFSPTPVSLPIYYSPAPVSLSIFLSPIPVVSLSYSHSCLPFYLSLTPVSPSPSLWLPLSSTPCLSYYLSLFCGSLSPAPISLFIFFSLLSLFLSFSRPYLSISLEPRSLFQSLFLSLSLSRSYLSFHLFFFSLSLSLPLLSFF